MSVYRCNCCSGDYYCISENCNGCEGCLALDKNGVCEFCVNQIDNGLNMTFIKNILKEAKKKEKHEKIIKSLEEAIENILIDD